MTDDPTQRFAALVAQSGGFPLDEAVLLVSAHALPGLDVARERQRLDELAVGVERPTIDALRRHLLADLGFAGDEASYHDPRNSLLPTVLDRRTGIPLSLAIVAIEVGRRSGISVVGVGMPGHFLVRGTDDPERFVDLFNGGTWLDRASCRAVFERLHAGAAWEDRFLEPVTNEAIVTRMLTNLANSYRRSGNRAALSWVIDLRLRMPGATDRDRRELGLLLGASGRYDAAADVLERSAEERDQQTAARLRARLN